MMSREIKFRAWDTSDKEKGPYILGPYDLTDSIFNHKEVRKLELMQYTGLKDKNGVEIYEGDIIQFKYVYSGRIWSEQRFENEPKITTEKVIYRDGMFTIGYRLPIKIAGDNYPYSERDENHAMTWTETYSEFEVVGNIHQNPELL